MTLHSIRSWIKARNHPLARSLYAVVMWFRHASLPTIPLVHAGLYSLQRTISLSFATLLRIVWTTPVFQSRLTRSAPRLHLYGAMPYIVGPVAITIGSDVEMGGKLTIFGRTATADTPELTIGNRSVIGFQSTLAVGRRIVIGDDVLFAASVFLAGYPGHPLDPEARAARQPDTNDQVGDIVIGDKVWLATGVKVMPGVTIGEGTVVAAGSVVTRDLPARVLAAGVPAKVVRQLADRETIGKSSVDEIAEEASPASLLAKSA